MEVALTTAPLQSANISYLPKQTSFLNLLKKDSTKRIINYSSNGIASAFNLFTFLNGNLHLLDRIQEKIEPLSELLSKIAFSVISLTVAVDFWQKKNLLPLLGYLSATPTAFLSSGYDFWLSLGVSSGLSNFIVIIDQREIVDKDGNPILDRNGNLQVINGDFHDRGWRKGISTTIKESIKIITELFKKPSRIKNISHSVLVASLFEMFGPIIALFGFKTLGSAIRNTATVAAEVSMSLHKDIKNSPSATTQKKIIIQNGINFKSPVAQSGLLWVGTSIIDLLKRFNFISDKVNNLTHLSLFLDRLASIRFNQGVLNIKKD